MTFNFSCKKSETRVRGVNAKRVRAGTLYVRTSGIKIGWDAHGSVGVSIACIPKKWFKFCSCAYDDSADLTNSNDAGMETQFVNLTSLAGGRGNRLQSYLHCKDVQYVFLQLDCMLSWTASQV